MKLHINMPDVEAGTELEIPAIGLVKQGETIDLNLGQIQGLRDMGIEIPQDGEATFNVYNVALEPALVPVESLNVAPENPANTVTPVTEPAPRAFYSGLGNTEGVS